MYLEDSAGFPTPREILGRYLGPAKGAGNEMSQWILRANGRVIPRRTVRPLNAIEIRSELSKQRRTEFDIVIHKQFGSPWEPPSHLKEYNVLDEYEDDSMLLAVQLTNSRLMILS
jgi:hypothetical protein